MEDIVSSRTGRRGIGFGSSLHQAEAAGALLRQTTPEDLHKFGLIPELVGRLPVIATVNDLSEEDLVEILKTPRNALTKQYQKMFELDGVKLEFTDEAMRKIAAEAIARGTGARGLRSILENILRELMFDIPSRDDVEKVLIDAEAVDGTGEALILTSRKDRTA